jgi:small subunit ribosomal protein S20
MFGVSSLANIKSAIKRARQSERRRANNKALRSRVRTEVKKVLSAIRDGDRKSAEASFKEAVPVIDSMVNKGILHANKAARHKSRLNQRIRSL